MEAEQKFAEAQRVLASLPKRASELTREELVDIVSQMQVYMYTETSINGNKIKEDGVEVWNPDADLGGADFTEAMDYLMTHYGLRPGDEFKGQKVVHP